MKNQYSGVVNLYKEPNMSSNTAMQKVRTIFDRVKGGHTGTLDPDAEGVLPIVLGKCTKLSNEIMSDEKEYRAELKLGVKTDTLDMSGTVLEEDYRLISEDDVVNAIKSFQKEYEQMPPMYSAIKIDGKKLYELARKGVEVERKTRLVNIKKIEVIEKKDDFTYIIDVTCSKGTYIRSLCSDIGEALGTYACMGKLIRTRTGDFDIKDSYKLEDLEKLKSENNLLSALITPDVLLKNYNKVVCKKEAYKFLINGNKLDINFLKKDKELVQNERVVVFDEENNLIGTYIVDGKFLSPDIILHIF